MKPNSTKNINIQIKGLVQGVGFRPFVYRLAIKKNIAGWVKNSRDGLLIKASGNLGNVDSFVSSLKNDFPVAAQIHDFKVSDSNQSYQNGFQIIPSEDCNAKNEITQIGPDIAVCPDCLEDMKTQHHRVNYPFINCTNCGPRFSIIRDLPYDRVKTTMDVFEMCPFCKGEYFNPNDRRFHAQPIACLHCGPHYKFITKQIETENLHVILSKSAEFIDLGKIIAIKGIGGFFIAFQCLFAVLFPRLRL